MCTARPNAKNIHSTHKHTQYIYVCRKMQKINGRFPLNRAQSVVRERITVLNSAVWLLNRAVIK